MRYRRKVAKRSSKRLFRKTAQRRHKKNRTTAGLMRGGIRL